jgi:repressor LexA
MLTRKQNELLLYINRHLTEKGVSPSFDEMKDALGLKSKSGIHRLITGLEERGFIKRLAHKARALEVIRLPEDLGIGGRKGEGGARFAPNVIQGNFGGAITGAAVATEVAAVQLPLYGRIAAGTPIEALRDHTSTIDVPGSLLGRGEHYALEVEGDSMVNAGILNGDTAIVERCDTAETGSIVVALVDNAEVTLKRLRRKGDSIALEPANPAFETRIFGPDRVQIQGRMVGLLRRF